MYEWLPICSMESFERVIKLLREDLRGLYSRYETLVFQLQNMLEKKRELLLLGEMAEKKRELLSAVEECFLDENLPQLLQKKEQIFSAVENCFSNENLSPPSPEELQRELVSSVKTLEDLCLDLKKDLELLEEDCKAISELEEWGDSHNWCFDNPALY